MICASCSASNAADAPVCVACGAALTQENADASASAPAGGAVYRDPRGLAKPLYGLLGGLGLVAIVGILMDVAQARLIGEIQGGAFASDAEVLAAAEANDTRQQITGVVYIIVFVATVVVFGMWIHRAAVNVRAFGAIGLKIRPGWAVGWYFVPVANLWLPYEAMSEIWRASRNPGGWSKERAGEFLGWWWAAWVVSLILGNIAMRMELNAEELDEILDATYFRLGVDVLDIASIVFGFLLVRRLSAQQARHRSLPAAAPAAIPS